MTMLRKILALCQGRLAPAGSHPPRIRPLPLSALALEFRRQTAATLGLSLKKMKTLLRMRKQAEHDHTHLHRLLVRNAPDGIFVVDGALKFVEVNDSLCRMWGLSRKQILEQTLPEILAGADCEQDLFCDLLARASCRGEVTITTPSSARILELEATPLQNGLYMGSARDITARKQYENELHRAAEWRALLLRSLNEGLALLDRDGRILLCNRVFESALGLSASMLQEVSLLNPLRENAKGECLWTMCSLQGVSVFGLENPFYRALHLHERRSDWRLQILPQGKIVAVDTAPLFDEHNSLLGAVVTLRDISASYQREQGEQDAHWLRRQASCLAAQRALAGEVVQRIQDPIHGIALYAQMLRDNAPQTCEDAVLVRGLLQETRGLLETMRELRALSQTHDNNRKAAQTAAQHSTISYAFDLLEAPAWMPDMN